MADVQKTYSLVAMGFILALIAGVGVWPPVISGAVSAMGSAGMFLLAILGFIPIFIVQWRPSLWSYLLFSATTEGFVLSAIPVYAYYLGAIAYAVVAGGALAFALIALYFGSEGRHVGGGVGAAAFGMIVLALIGSLALVVGSFFNWYSWHIDLATTAIALIAFALFAAYDASRVREYPDEYRAAVSLLMDMVGLIMELLRLLFLLQRRD